MSVTIRRRHLGAATVDAQANEVLYVQVGGYGGASGTFTLTVQ